MGKRCNSPTRLQAMTGNDAFRRLKNNFNKVAWLRLQTLFRLSSFLHPKNRLVLILRAFEKKRRSTSTPFICIGWQMRSHMAGDVQYIALRLIFLRYLTLFRCAAGQSFGSWSPVLGARHLRAVCGQLFTWDRTGELRASTACQLTNDTSSAWHRLLHRPRLRTGRVAVHRQLPQTIRLSGALHSLTTFFCPFYQGMLSVRIVAKFFFEKDTSNNSVGAFAWIRC